MKKLGQYLVEKGWLTVPQVNQGLRHQKVFGGRLGTCLLELNLLGEDRLTRALSELLSLPAAPVEALRNIDESARELLPARMACKSRVVVFEAYATEASVCLLDAKDLMLQDELSFIVSRRLKFHVAPEVRILEALERFYQCDVEARYRRIWDRLNRARYLWQEGAEEAAAEGEIAPSTGPVWAPEAAPELQTPNRSGKAGEPQIGKTPGTPQVPPLPEPSPGREEIPGTGRRETVPSETSTVETDRKQGAADEGPPTSVPTPTPTISDGDESRTPEGDPPEEREGPAEEKKVSETGSTRPIEAMPVPETPEELQEAMNQAGERDQIASLLLDYLRERFDRVLLFMVRGEEVAGWMGAGAEVDQEALQSFTLDFDGPSLFLNLREGSPYFRGPLPRMDRHRRLVEVLGRRPKDCLALPLEIKDRVVGVAYCDRGGEAMGDVDMAAMQELARITKRAFEAFLLRRKRSQQY
ncbi:MAG: hypothetical protein R3234_12145 [Thermoanaerobaculia bacterium]|nr:hypothetical protein [Thermoanaerobaculia bacterium]